MSFTVRSIAISTVPMRTRMPFRYGIAKLEALPHIFMKVTLESRPGGRTAEGVSADGLLPKWFEKDPNTTGQQDLQRMHSAIVHAGKLAQEASPFEHVFNFWHELYKAQSSWGERKGFAPLLSHFGVSLVERAVIDATCRYWGVPFVQALAENRFGVDVAAVHPDISPGAVQQVLRRKPLESIYARHTVGLSDAILPADVEQRLGDGLPESLEDDIREYGLKYFKIKVCGDAEVDLSRLRRISELFGRLGLTDFHFTLDGNEQFHDVDTFRAFWERVQRDPKLSGFFSRLLFVEQPFTRKIALSDEVARGLRGWPDAPAMIIDESDGALEDLPRALSCGYVGTSHKNCKGVFKGIVNAAFIHDVNKRAGATRHFMSGEDLVNIGPVALLQDLAVMAVLNISHVERNGHHYFRGLSMFRRRLQEEMIKHHGDLYCRHPGGYAALRITDGQITTRSLLHAPFGVAFIPHESEYIPVDEWQCPALPET